MRIIVQKFGGTSMATPEAREAVADRVIAAREKGYTPVVVVSAMGRAGEPYATDTLIAMALEVCEETAARELDLLISCGEIMSAVILSSHLRRHGFPTCVLSGGQAGIVTDLNFGNARILRVEPDHLLRHLERGDLVVVAGFQGVAETGDITTLGRGGSDTTAAALGVALRAEIVEIYTDVDGVKTADPRIVPEARTLRALSYEEILQMASEGARVIHPRAIELARQAHVPLRVRSTFDDGPGTLVTHTFEVGRGGDALFTDQRIITGVAQIPDACQIAIELEEGAIDDADLRIFGALAQSGISVDLINVSPRHKSFIVKGDEARRAERILREAGFAPRLRPGVAKVSVVGLGMRGVPGVMASVVEALHQEGIRILQTADSHATISCLVERAQMEAAIRALHRKFRLAD